MYLLATIVSFSRVYLGKHYPLDVLGGAFLGLVVGIGAIALMDLLKAKFRHPKENAAKGKERFA